MLVVSKNRYVPTSVNMTVLQDKEGNYYYMHRSLYDQCVVLSDVYSAVMSSYWRLFDLTEETLPDKVREFYDSAPAPVNVLAPFLTLVGRYEEIESLEDMCGALSTMSMSVDFRKFPKVPAAVRSSVRFSLRVCEEYQIQWDRFFQENPMLDQVSFSARPYAPAASVAVTGPDVEEGEDDVDLMTEEEAWAAWAEKMLDEEEAAAAAAGATPLPTPSETAEPASAPKSGFSMLMGVK